MYNGPMPELGSKKKEKENLSSLVGDKSKVVSAYSSEGEARIKQQQRSDRRFKIILLVVMASLFIAFAAFVIIAQLNQGK